MLTVALTRNERRECEGRVRETLGREKGLVERGLRELGMEREVVGLGEKRGVGFSFREKREAAEHAIDGVGNRGYTLSHSLTRLFVEKNKGGGLK